MGQTRRANKNVGAGGKKNNFPKLQLPYRLGLHPELEQANPLGAPNRLEIAASEPPLPPALLPSRRQRPSQTSEGANRDPTMTGPSIGHLASYNTWISDIRGQGPIFRPPSAQVDPRCCFRRQPQLPIKNGFQREGGHVRAPAKPHRRLCVT